MAGELEFRCPVYGFIPVDKWEHEILSQPAFQRLRRVRQLAWTDYVYPGAMHTRFEHSLGVMHMATQLYDGIVERNKRILFDELDFDDAGIRRYRKLVRLAALLHDVGHGPFSHAAEDLTPSRDGEKIKHEEYSSAIIKLKLRDVIENHPANHSYNFRAEEISGLIEGGAAAGKAVMWQEIISGQLDADRMDYLLRDSYHAGVEYGRYDWRRIVATVQLVKYPESGSYRLGIHSSGRHAAEGLIIARYMMFNQLYFHKTRVILDYHLQKAMQEILPGGVFPETTPEGIDEYLKWDDWRVLGLISQGQAGDHGNRLLNRNFFRCIFKTPEFPSEDDRESLTMAENAIVDLSPIKREAGKSWYKLGGTDIQVKEEDDVFPLSSRSTIVANMKPSRVARLYVDKGNRDAALRVIGGMGKRS